MKLAIKKRQRMTGRQLDSWLAAVKKEYGRDMWAWPQAIRDSIPNIQLVKDPAEKSD
jgi:hypothetical protein